MGSYTGPATLIAPDGTEYEVEVTVTTSFDGRFKTWSGTGIGESNIAGAGECTRLRLPDGSEGAIVMRNSASSFGQRSSSGVPVAFSGSGAPPTGVDA